MSIQYTILLLYLGMETDTDINRKEISVTHFWFAWLIMFAIGSRYLGMEMVLGGMAPGILLMALSKVTDGGVGYGDGMVLIICGMVVGLEKACGMFLLALLLMLPVSLWKITVNRESAKEEMAFLPYLLASYLILLLLM